MRTGALVASLLWFVAGCFGAEIEGRSQTVNPTVDAAATAPEPDAEIVMTMPDAPAMGGVPAAACMAKGYVAVAGLTSLYRSSTQAKDWLVARDDCAADVPGATHLVVLSSTAEVQYVKSQLGWVGLSDRATENVFVNVTNEANDLRPFRSGQPDNGSGTEHCVQMKSDGLDDDQCDETHAYVCECDGRAPVP